MQDSLLCRGTGHCNPWNRPPVATAPSVIPVPYTGRGQGFATFQVTAFDPDMQSVAGGQMRTEDVLYRFATEEEMGGVSGGCLAANADPAACGFDELGAPSRSCLPYNCQVSLRVPGLRTESCSSLFCVFAVAQALVTL